jgi:hypothetical protein
MERGVVGEMEASKTEPGAAGNSWAALELWAPKPNQTVRFSWRRAHRKAQMGNRFLAASGVRPALGVGILKPKTEPEPEPNPNRPNYWSIRVFGFGFGSYMCYISGYGFGFGS